MSLVWPHHVTSYAITIFVLLILGKKRPQKRYGWSFLRQWSQNNLCIADRSGSNLCESCPSRDLRSKPLQAFLKVQILGRGPSLAQMILGLTWRLFIGPCQYMYLLEELEQELERERVSEPKRQPDKVWKYCFLWWGLRVDFLQAYLLCPEEGYGRDYDKCVDWPFN